MNAQIIPVFDCIEGRLAGHIINWLPPSDREAGVREAEGPDRSGLPQASDNAPRPDLNTQCLGTQPGLHQPPDQPPCDGGNLTAGPSLSELSPWARQPFSFLSHDAEIARARP